MNKTTFLGYLGLALSISSAFVGYFHGKRSQEENIKKAVAEYMSKNK